MKLSELCKLVSERMDKHPKSENIWNVVESAKLEF